MVQRYKFESKSQLYTAFGNRAACCFQWFKGTNLKANHNKPSDFLSSCKLFPMVQRYKFESKSQPYWSITTTSGCCFQWFKGTNLKANHNTGSSAIARPTAVSNGSKVQIWKQITTPEQAYHVVSGLFPMVQRYKFESKSQRYRKRMIKEERCFQWFKGTNLKANHNESGNSKFRAGAVPNSSKIEIQSKSQRQCKEPIENKCCFLCPKDRKIESKSQQPATTSPTSICCVQWL